MSLKELNFGNDKKSALEAKFDAQKIAFAPIMFQAALALRDLGILEVIHNRRREGIGLEEVAAELGLSVYGVKVLLEAGLSMELVYAEEGRFRLTKTGWHILRDRLTRVNMDFTNDVNYLGMHSLQESVRQGKPTGLPTLGDWDTIYEGLFDLPQKAQESWFAFDHYYSDYSFSEILDLVIGPGVKKILDVGGNTGKFALQCVSHHPDVEVCILDHPAQVAKALASAAEAGYGERVSGQAMNLLDHGIAFPGGMDVIWMSQFLDCFSKADILGLLNRAREALGEEGTLYILELYWDRQKFPASTYSLHATSLYFTNMANGCSQMYHSGDMMELLKEAGLELEASQKDIGVSHTLFTCKKRK
jgi:hypothetical protein